MSRSFINLDDQDYVVQNSRVCQGLTAEGIRWAFADFHASNWHPLTWISHMADVSLFGLDPWGHHVTSVVLHALTAALLFVALHRLTSALWPSALAAALFGVHPLRVESVAWVAERKDVLAGLFFALMLLAYERYARRGGAALYSLVALLLALGLMAKPMLMTAPLLLLLLDYWPLGRTRPAADACANARQATLLTRLFAEKTPFLALATASGALTFLAQKNSAVASVTFLGPEVRIPHAVVSFVAYLVKTIWPVDLAIYYPHPLATPPGWQLWGSLLVLAASSCAVLVQIRRHPYLAVGWFWFLGMLVPVVGFVQVGEQALADRYTYLPHVGLFLLLAWGLPDAFRGWRLRLPVLPAAALSGIAILTIAAAHQARLWKDGETIFRHTLAVTSANWMIQNNLGIELAKTNRLAEALSCFRETLRISPGNADAYNNIGIILARQGQISQAIDHFREAIRLRPVFAEGQNNLGRTLLVAGRLEEAVAPFREALRLQPDRAEAQRGLDDVFLRLERTREANYQQAEASRLQGR